jgi:hypothetical protein
MWSTSLEGFGATTITNSVKAYAGIGTPEQVAEAEWFAQGNEGGDANYRTRAFAPAYTPRRDSEDAHYYSIVTFNHSHVQHEDLGGTNTSPKSVFLACGVGGTAAAAVTATSLVGAEGVGTETGILFVLDAYFAAAGKCAANYAEGTLD